MGVLLGGAESCRCPFRSLPGCELGFSCLFPSFIFSFLSLFFPTPPPSPLFLASLFCGALNNSQACYQLEVTRQPSVLICPESHSPAGCWPPSQTPHLCLGHCCDSGRVVEPFQPFLEVRWALLRLCCKQVRPVPHFPGCSFYPRDTLPCQ